MFVCRGCVVAWAVSRTASSAHLSDRNGKFETDAIRACSIVSAGQRRGLSDLDGDGYAELILACEWGPIKIFRNDRGRFVAWDPPVESINHQPSTISRFTGWWNSVTAADLDGDGRMDLIAGNWGLNTKYRATADHPRKLYYGDFAESGTVDTIDTYFDQRMGKEVPEREFDAMAGAMPFLRGIFATHRAYGAASISEVLGEHLKQAKQVSANTLASMLFLNRGDHFEIRPLPPEAQLAPAFAVVVADFDGDGAEDVFLSQNFFATEPQTSRCDAGRGLLLLGDGKGNLRPVPARKAASHLR
jgi:hypothetical protein